MILILCGFQDKDFWTAKGSRNLDVGEMTYNKSSRLEQKRSQRWCLDSSDTNIIPNKKQIVEFPGNTSFSGLLTSTTSHWKYASNSQPVTGHFHERPFDPETERGMNFDHWNASSVGISTMNLGRKVLEDQFENSSSCNHNSGLDYSGIRKVKVSQVNDSENYMSAALERFCARGDSDIMPLSHPYIKAADASLTMGLPFNKKDESALTNTFNREDDSLISMGEFYNEDDCHISIGQSYKIDNDPLIKSYFLNKDDTDVLAMMDNDAFKDRDDVIPVVQSFSKNDNNVMSIGQIFNKQIDATLCIGQTDKNADVGSFSQGHTCNSMSNMGLPMGLSFSNGESTIISFGGLNDNEDGSPGEGLECSHDLLMVQSSVLNSEALNQKQLIESNADLLASDSQMISHVDSFPHKKVEQKANRKAPLNNFPSNVKSLLSTGIFDGVPVKYVSWSREVISCCHEFFILINLTSNN